MSSEAVPQSAARWEAPTGHHRAADSLREARAHERAGSIAEAFDGYRAAVSEAARAGERSVEAEALRRLAVLHHHRNERDTARELSSRSYAIAREIGDQVLAAEALNVLACFGFESGAMEEARARYQEALEARGHGSGPPRAD